MLQASLTEPQDEEPPRYTPLERAVILADFIYVTTGIAHDPGSRIDDIRQRLYAAVKMANDVVVALHPATVIRPTPIVEAQPE